MKEFNKNNMVSYPNKIYIGEYDRTVPVFGRIKKTVIIAASDEQAAKEHLYKIMGNYPDNLIWLMGCNYNTIYNQTGNIPLKRQAKILYNS